MQTECSVDGMCVCVPVSTVEAGSGVVGTAAALSLVLSTAAALRVRRDALGAALAAGCALDAAAAALLLLAVCWQLPAVYWTTGAVLVPTVGGVVLLPVAAAGAVSVSGACSRRRTAAVMALSVVTALLAAGVAVVFIQHTQRISSAPPGLTTNTPGSHPSQTQTAKHTTTRAAAVIQPRNNDKQIIWLSTALRELPDATNAHHTSAKLARLSKQTKYKIKLNIDMANAPEAITILQEANAIFGSGHNAASRNQRDGFVPMTQVNFNGDQFDGWIPNIPAVVNAPHSPGAHVPDPVEPANQHPIHTTEQSTEHSDTVEPDITFTNINTTHVNGNTTANSPTIDGTQPHNHYTTLLGTAVSPLRTTTTNHEHTGNPAGTEMVATLAATSTVTTPAATSTATTPTATSTANTPTVALDTPAGTETVTPPVATVTTPAPTSTPNTPSSGTSTLKTPSSATLTLNTSSSATSTVTTLAAASTVIPAAAAPVSEERPCDHEGEKQVPVMVSVPGLLELVAQERAGEVLAWLQRLRAAAESPQYRLQDVRLALSRNPASQQLQLQLHEKWTVTSVIQMGTQTDYNTATDQDDTEKSTRQLAANKNEKLRRRHPPPHSGSTTDVQIDGPTSLPIVYMKPVAPSASTLPQTATSMPHPATSEKRHCDPALWQLLVTLTVTLVCGHAAALCRLWRHLRSLTITCGDQHHCHQLQRDAAAAMLQLLSAFLAAQTPQLVAYTLHAAGRPHHLPTAIAAVLYSFHIAFPILRLAMIIRQKVLRQTVCSGIIIHQMTA